jgi:hypothetical protein
MQVKTLTELLVYFFRNFIQNTDATARQHAAAKAKEASQPEFKHGSGAAIATSESKVQNREREPKAAPLLPFAGGQV